MAADCREPGCNYYLQEINGFSGCLLCERRRLQHEVLDLKKELEQLRTFVTEWQAEAADLAVREPEEEVPRWPGYPTVTYGRGDDPRPGCTPASCKHIKRPTINPPPPPPPDSNPSEGIVDGSLGPALAWLGDLLFGRWPTQSWTLRQEAISHKKEDVGSL